MIEQAEKRKKHVLRLCLSDTTENLGMCVRGWGVERDGAKAGRWEEEEVWVLLDGEQLFPLILFRISLGNTSVTYRQNW